MNQKLNRKIGLKIGIQITDLLFGAMSHKLLTCGMILLMQMRDCLCKRDSIVFLRKLQNDKHLFFVTYERAKRSARVLDTRQGVISANAEKEGNNEKDVFT